MKTRGVVFAVLALPGFAFALLSPNFHLLGIAWAIVFLLLAANTFARARGMRDLLRPWAGQTVEVEVWGVPLTEPLTIHAVHSLSAGLLIFMKPGRPLLKVAQGNGASMSGDRFEIAEARYISWRGRKLAKKANVPAMVIRLAASGSESTPRSTTTTPS